MGFASAFSEYISMTLGQSVWNAIPWYGVLVSVLCAGFVRFCLRPALSKRFAVFARNMSAPYFFLFAIAIFVAMVELVLVNRPAAELTVTAAYYVLLIGAIVAFFSSWF